MRLIFGGVYRSDGSPVWEMTRPGSWRGCSRWYGGAGPVPPRDVDAGVVAVGRWHHYAFKKRMWRKQQVKLANAVVRADPSEARTEARRAAVAQYRQEAG